MELSWFAKRLSKHLARSTRAGRAPDKPGSRRQNLRNILRDTALFVKFAAAQQLRRDLRKIAMV
jgi:hypothetical protein